MAEEAMDRRLDRHLFGVSPPTPTASSPGPNSAAQGSIDAAKKASLSGTSAAPPRPHTGTASASRLLCRPWDCGDFFRRLGTFRLGKWNHKPQTIGPAVCARKGWVNVDVDEINCDCCEAQLCFVVQPGLEETAAEAFRDQLETAHKQSCPWKGNSCAESLAQFPTSLMALIGGYNDRCDALLQLPAVPIVSSFALDQMKASRGPQLERVLSQPPPVPGFSLRDKAGMAETSNSNHVYYKAQRLISLCGWEARLLPNAADFEDHSAQSTRNACSIGPSRPSHKRSKRNPMVYNKAEKEGDSRRTRVASAVLECNYCAANVNITSVPSVARPGLGGSSTEYVESEKKAQTLVRGASAASGIGGEFRNQPAQPLDGGNEATASEKRTEDAIAAARAGTLPAAAAAARPLQPEGSEMGDCGVASYESRREEQQGASSICMPRLKAAVSESGTNGEHEVDEVDNADGKSSAAESSKRRRAGDNLAADQASLGMALSASATGEGDADAEVNDRKNKRLCIGLSADRIPTASIENSRDRRRGLIPVNESVRTMTRRLTSDFPCSSSVNATDTCFQNKRENSMDSVECMPHDDAQQNTAASGYTENEWLFDEPNSVAQAQHSESYVQVHAQRGTTEDETNAAVISTGTATAGGGSVGAAVSYRVQSNEADIVGADFSEHQTDSVAGEAAVVIDALEQQALSGDIGLVCDSAPPPVTTQDGSDAVLSLCPGASSAKDLGADSVESGSKASQKPRNGFVEEDRTADTANAVIVGTSTATYARELAEPSVEAPDERTVANSSGTATAPRDVDERHFDPVRRHRSFCPWVNGLVLAAANGTFGSNSEAACGWQLTVDALDAFHTQDGVPVGATESESTASMCKE